MSALKPLGFLLVTVSFLSPCAAQVTALLSPDQSVAGLSQADWSRRWWQWAASFEGDDSPVADETGTACGNGQSGPVWFLAGTYGTRRTVRTCTVPAGKYLFFPLINYIVVPNAEGAITCEDATSTARSMTDAPFTLVLELDGQQIADLAAFRQAPSTCFDAAARRRGGPRVFPSAANGYYVMLSPLSPGKHVLNFGGVLPEMSQAVTYTLLIQ